MSGSATLMVFRLPGGGADLGLAPQDPSGPPKFLALLATHTPLFVAPDRPSGRSPTRVLWGGFWGVTTIAVCMRRAHGAVSRFREGGLSGGLRGALWTLHRWCAASPPSQRHPAVGVIGATCLRRDVHPARNAKLRLAHQRWRSPAAGSGRDAGADAGGGQVQCVVRCGPMAVRGGGIIQRRDTLGACGG